MTSNKALFDAAEKDYARQIAGHASPSMTPKEYRGLHGNVVVLDCYHLRSLPFVPDVILDIGANIGVFTRFARELFPGTTIIAVEPDKRNFGNLCALTPERSGLVLLNQALGRGQIWEGLHPINGAHAAYLSETAQLDEEWFSARPQRFVRSDVKSIMLDDLWREYSRGRVFCKIDCEGAERSIFVDPASMEVLAGTEGFAMELHSMDKYAAQALCVLSETHKLEWDSQVIHAAKRAVS